MIHIKSLNYSIDNSMQIYSSKKLHGELTLDILLTEIDTNILNTEESIKCEMINQLLKDVYGVSLDEFKQNNAESFL